MKLGKIVKQSVFRFGRRVLRSDFVVVGGTPASAI